MTASTVHVTKPTTPGSDAPIARQNPQLYQLINSNQEEFLALLNEPAPADALQNLAAGLGGMEGMEGMEGMVWLCTTS
jgi:hypothetical protein